MKFPFMDNLCNYMDYIKEDFEIDYFNFEVGENVIVVGTVDGRTFNNVIARIERAEKGQYETNMDKHGETYEYDHMGMSYYIIPKDGSNSWWVPKFNLRHIEEENKPIKTRWYKKGKFTNE